MLFKDITIIGENYQISEHMYLLTEGEEITYIGTGPPENCTDNTYETFDGKGKVLAPGFYNTHSHIPMTLLRGYGEGISLHDWLFTKVFPFEDLLTDDDCYWGTLLGAIEMIGSGTCSFTDMYMFMKGIISGVATSGLKANLSRSLASGLSNKVAANDMKVLLDFMKTRDDNRIKADISIHAEYTTNKEIITEISNFCKKHNLNMDIHLSETQSEHDKCKEKYGMTPTELFNKLGTFDNKTNAAHCVWVEDSDMDILASKGVTVAHCPSSNLKLGSGIAPVMRMLEKGINLTIGTDGAASNNNLNMLEEINLAALLQKGATKNPAALSTVDIMTMACKNGARSQSRDSCGEIKVGNHADIVVYDFDKAHLQPVYDVLSNLIYSAQSSDIVMNMVDGRVLYRDGVFLTIDVEQVLYQTNRIKNDKLSKLSN